MARLQSNLSRIELLDHLPEPANSDALMPAITPDQKIISWLFRMTAQKNSQYNAPAPQTSESPFERSRKFLIERARKPLDDWQTIASLSGHNVQDLLNADILLPLTAAEVDHFLRNHREMDRLVGRDFLSLKCDLPTPVAELYGLYKHRARLDTEAALFVTQATGSTRIPRTMAHLLAIAAFASGYECISHGSMNYSVPTAFDTADLIDRSCDEAGRRLAMPIENPSHLLKLSPDEISVLASNIVDRYAMSSFDFLNKASLLSEARQDVHRLPIHRHFQTAYHEGDLPAELPWVQRLRTAYAAIFPNWAPDPLQECITSSLS